MQTGYTFDRNALSSAATYIACLRTMVMAHETMEATERLLAGIRALDGVHVWGEPDMCVFSVGSHGHDILAVGDILNERGWHFDRQEGPRRST